jgi:hypothetical protein
LVARNQNADGGAVENGGMNAATGDPGDKGEQPAQNSFDAVIKVEEKSLDRREFS